MVSFMTNNNNRSIIHVYVYFLSFLLLLLLTSYTSAQSSNERRLPPPPPPPPPPSARTFRPSMIVVIVVLIVAFFFMGFFSIYIRQCVNRSRPGDTIRPANGGAGGGGGGRSRRAKKGLDPSVIETFPTFIYSAVKALKLGKGTLECAVCLNEFEDDETLRLLPKCDHVFHPECIDAWLLSHTTCPVCRSNLNEINYSTTIDESGSQIENQNDSDDDESESDSEIQTSSGINNQSQEHVLIRVIDDKKIKSESSSTTITTTTSEPELINPSEKIQIQNRPVRSRSVRPSSKFPRSHSTGHSLIQPGENFDRFTLKLPEDIRKQIIEESQLNRMVRQTSVSGDENNRRGFRSGSVGTNRGGRFYQFGRLSKSDHWGFKLAVPFFTRSTSSRDPITLTDSSVKSPFDRLGSKRERANHPPSSPPPPPQSQQPQPPIRRPAV